MSYNLIDWKKVEAKDFKINNVEFFEHDWDREQFRHDARVRFTNHWEDCWVEGWDRGDHILVHDVCFCGEGSGNSLRCFLNEMETSSEGRLVAYGTWECGSIEILQINEGRVSRQDLDIEEAVLNQLF